MTLLSLALTDLTAVWQLYFGLIFIAVVMYAPGGIAGLLMQHRPVLRAGKLGRCSAPISWRRCRPPRWLAGRVLAIEIVVHHTVNATDDPRSTVRHALDPKSLVWLLPAAVLLVGGLFVARLTWRRIVRAWDEAMTAARAKGFVA